MAFKLGSEKRRDTSTRIHTPDNTPILKKTLGEGIKAEANNDGTIFVDHSVKEGTEEFNTVVKHEMQHMNDMATGRAQYGDNWVMWEGDIFFRKEIDGVMYIDGPAGRLEEGDERHPWEEAAIIAEGLKTYEGDPVEFENSEENENNNKSI